VYKRQVEGQTIKFSIVRTGDDAKRVAVTWSLDGLERGDLEPGQNLNGELVFAAGEGGAKTLRFRLREDGRDEGPEAFSLQLGALSRKSAALGTREVEVDLLDGQVGSGGADVLNGTDADEVLIGRGGADRIRGRGGADELRGDGGDDLLLGGSGADDIRGAAGEDLIRAGGGDDSAFGGGGADLILGNGGDDMIDGGGGADILFGGRGADLFRFGFGQSGPARPDRDAIQDFDVGEDRIDLFERAIAFAFIDAAAFTGVAGQIRTVARDGRTLLQGDEDGDGAADVAVWLAGTGLGLTSGDFI